MGVFSCWKGTPFFTAGVTQFPQLLILAPWKAWCDNINYLWNVGDSDFLKWLYDFDALHSQEKIIAGSPQTVKEQVWRAIDDSNINYFISAWGNISHEKAMRSMNYFVNDAMPSAG